MIDMVFQLNVFNSAKTDHFGYTPMIVTKYKDMCYFQTRNRLHVYFISDGLKRNI